jgi:hypothetical protein
MLVTPKSIAEILGAAMRRLETKRSLAAERRLAAYREARDQTRLDLIEAAREAENRNCWPQYLWPDGNEDAWFKRKYSVLERIKERGNFSDHVAMLAITDRDWENKETVAAWLRRELKVLRDAEAQSGTAPVRRDRALSRTVISDIAIELLEGIGGEELTCLFLELLDVDRHRKSVSEVFTQRDRVAASEALLELQGLKMGVRAFGNHLSVAPSSVTRWRRNPAYRERVDIYKTVWGRVLRDDYFDQIRSENPAFTEAECFRRAFQLYLQSIPMRRGKA